jgi:uncharacterized protein YbaP (TraB family)
MKKILTIFLFFSITPASLFAQSSVWKIKSKSSEVYLGGTIHLLRELDFPLPAEFDMAYEASSVLVFETDMKALEAPEFQQKLLEKSMYPGDSTIKDVLSAETYKMLEDECTESGLPFAQIQKLRPSVLIITLVAIQYQKLGINAPGVDVHYSRRGMEDAKAAQFLETVDEQVNLLANMGKGHEDEFVQQSINDLKKVETQMLAMIDSWRNGSRKESEVELQEMKRDYPELYHDLLVKRNNAWMPKVETFFETEEVEFILVGNLHLHGEDGLLAQLKKKGYRIKQLKSK